MFSYKRLDKQKSWNLDCYFSDGDIEENIFNNYAYSQKEFIHLQSKSILIYIYKRANLYE